MDWSPLTVARRARDRESQVGSLLTAYSLYVAKAVDPLQNHKRRKNIAAACE